MLFVLFITKPDWKHLHCYPAGRQSRAQQLTKLEPVWARSQLPQRAEEKRTLALGPELCKIRPYTIQENSNRQGKQELIWKLIQKAPIYLRFGLIFKKNPGIKIKQTWEMKILYLFKKNPNRRLTQTVSWELERLMFSSLCCKTGATPPGSFPMHLLNRVSKMKMLQKPAAFLRSMILIHFFLSCLLCYTGPSCFL